MLTNIFQIIQLAEITSFTFRTNSETTIGRRNAIRNAKRFSSN